MLAKVILDFGSARLRATTVAIDDHLRTALVELASAGAVW